MAKNLAVNRLPLESSPAVQTWTANCKRDRKTLVTWYLGVCRLPLTMKNLMLKVPNICFWDWSEAGWWLLWSSTSSELVLFLSLVFPGYKRIPKVGTLTQSFYGARWGTGASREVSMTDRDSWGQVISTCIAQPPLNPDTCYDWTQHQELCSLFCFRVKVRVCLNVTAQWCDHLNWGICWAHGQHHLTNYPTTLTCLGFELTTSRWSGDIQIEPIGRLPKSGGCQKFCPYTAPVVVSPGWTLGLPVPLPNEVCDWFERLGKAAKQCPWPLLQ